MSYNFASSDDLLPLLDRIAALESAHAALATRLAALESVPPIPEPEPPEPIPPDPEPEPPEPPDPKPNPLPGFLEVGPGRQFEELDAIDPFAVADETTIVVWPREAPYRNKFTVLANGVHLKAERGPNGERPVISGLDSKCHINTPSQTLQTVHVLCVGGIQKRVTDIKITGFKIQDAYENDKFFFNDGHQGVFGGGAAGVLVRNAIGVTIDDCEFYRMIHGVFCKTGLSESNYCGDLQISNCVTDAIGDADGLADEAFYTESFRTVVKGNTIKNLRNGSTTGWHSRDNEFIFENNEVETSGVCVFTNSLTEKAPHYFVGADGKLKVGHAVIRRNTFISGSAGETFSQRTEVGENHAIRTSLIEDNLFISRQDLSVDWKHGVISLFGPTYESTMNRNTFVLMSRTEGVPGTGVLVSERATGTINMGPGNKQYIQNTNAPMGSVGNVRGEPIEDMRKPDGSRWSWAELHEMFLTD